MKRNYVVEYSYQTPYMADEAQDVCVVAAESDDEAIELAQGLSKSGWIGADDVTPCETKERDFVVDLCEGGVTVCSFVVKGILPIMSKAKTGKPYSVMLDRIKDMAREVIIANYPEFWTRMNLLRGRVEGFEHLSYEDVMMIVRPAIWIKPGEGSYEVRVDFESEYGRDYFFETVRAIDADGAAKEGCRRIREKYENECKILSSKAMRIAEVGAE